MTPAELGKSLTLLPHERLNDTGFAKKRIGTLRRKADACCIAAVLCLLERWGQLEQFLQETQFLTEEHKERIGKYLPPE